MEQANNKQKQTIASTISALAAALPVLNKKAGDGARFLKQSILRSSPSYPALVFTTSQSIKMCYNEEDISRIKLSDYQYQSGKQLMFDVRGKKWTFNYSKPPFSINFWNELRNPEYLSGLQWKYDGAFSLNELKHIIYELLERGDDVLTEHENEQFLKTRLENSKTFTDILNILKKYVFEVNESELWKEQEKRGSDL